MSGILDTLVAVACWGGYFVGWFGGTVVGARWLASHMEACQARESYGYIRCVKTHVGGGHWRGDGQVGYREMWSAALPSLVWPLALIPFAAYYVANHKPTPKAQAHRIAELERELGIGDKR